MLRITIELLPLGFEERKRTLGITEIENDGTGNPAKGNYRFRIWGENDVKQGKEIPWKRGNVTGFNRRLSSWQLLYLVLKEAFGR